MINVVSLGHSSGGSKNHRLSTPKNLQAGLLASVAGAQVIFRLLVAKSMQVFIGGAAGGLIRGQTLQPLDVLIMQANTNVLSSHFVSLACLLWLARMINLLDPPPAWRTTMMTDE